MTRAVRMHRCLGAPGVAGERGNNFARPVNFLAGYRPAPRDWTRLLLCYHISQKTNAGRPETQDNRARVS
jgi:hypothetical protein